MSIRKTFLLLFVFSLVMSMLPTSCNKNGYTITNTTADSSTQIIMANDELKVNYEFDQAVNEALLATTLSSIASGDTASPGTGTVLYNTISGAIVDTSHINDSSLIHITYYGKNADQTKGRTGLITIQFSRDGNDKIIPWKTPGAIVNITFQQYEVIVLATNVSLWMNGTATITNTSGGLLKKPSNITLQPGDSLRDRLSGNIVFTYNDNTTLVQTWTWNINQARTFNLQNSVLTCTIRGDSTVSGSNGISTTGTTRFNNIFYTQLTAPIVQNISASYILSNPLSGEKVIHGISEQLTIDYGVNSSGSFVQSSPYGYKITWVHSGGQAVSVVSY